MLLTCFFLAHDAFILIGTQQDSPQFMRHSKRLIETCRCQQGLYGVWYIFSKEEHSCIIRCRYANSSAYVANESVGLVTLRKCVHACRSQRTADVP